MDVGFDSVIQTAKKMGISSSLGRNLSLSLGTSELSPLELTSAYTVFPNSGVHVTPTLVKRIEDRFGNVLEDNTELPLLDESEIPLPIPRKEFRELWTQTAQKGTNSRAKDDSSRVQAAISPQTAYIMTALLHGGVTQGTGARLKNYLNRRDLAGKTGTTNNSEDTWFIGFSPDYTAGVWVGFDEKRPLGHREQGGSAALPIWAYFMKDILGNRPEKEFIVPPDIIFQDLVTFSGDSKSGFGPRMVREPVYKPFSGRTLVLSPLDSPQALSPYAPASPGPAPGQPPVPGWQFYESPPPNVMPIQPGIVHPEQPADRRAVPPDQGQQSIAPIPPGLNPSWNPQQPPVEMRAQQGVQPPAQAPAPGHWPPGTMRVAPEVRP